MKSAKLFLTGLCLSLLATFSFANGNDDSENVIMRVEPTETKAIHITLANLQKETTNLALKTLNGQVYYHDTIRNHNGYGKNLNLRKLPKGRYLLTVSQKDTEWTSVIFVDEDEVRVSRIVEK